MAEKFSEFDICSEFPAYYKYLSRRLYKVLDDVGASTLLRDMAVKTNTAAEIISSVCMGLGGTQQYYVFGSTFEGTSTLGLGSDVDIVLVEKCHPVVTDIIESQQYQTCLLLIQDHYTPPGYAKLQKVIYGLPLTSSVPVDYRLERVDAENRIVKILPDWARLPGAVLNGPASTVEGVRYIAPRDIVHALRCSTWPDCASEWLTRTRHYNWPTQDQINKCTNLGFFLVYVGHPNCQEKYLQWRISFSLQERMLVINFNAVQLKCYVLAKMIKKELIHKPLGEKSLSSYHLKTCMFYMIEETPAEFWVEHNLLYCLHHILKRMLIWVERGDCPNYFIPGENMFEERISEETQLKLCKLLKRIIAANFKYLVTMKTDELGDRYQEALVSGVRASRYLSRGAMSCKYTMFELVHHVLTLRLQLLCKYTRQATQTAVQVLDELKARLPMTETVADHTVEEVRYAVSLLVPYVDIQLMSLDVVLAKHTSKSSAFIFNLLTSEKWHALSLESDGFSSKLKQASLLYMLEHYEMSLEVLDSLQKQMKRKLCTRGHYHELTVSACSYYNGARMPAESELRMHCLPLEVSSYEEFFHRHVIPCVVFLPAERLLTPPALCNEMNRSADSPPDSKEDWYDFAVVDGKVLLHYLFYLNHSQLSMNANASGDVENIQWLIKTDSLLGHKETALNLLGLIYKERGLVDRAVDCFRGSLTIQPSHNAATLHLQDICRNRSRTC